MSSLAVPGPRRSSRTSNATRKRKLAEEEASRCSKKARSTPPLDSSAPSSTKIAIRIRRPNSPRAPSYSPISEIFSPPRSPQATPDTTPNSFLLRSPTIPAGTIPLFGRGEIPDERGFFRCRCCTPDPSENVQQGKYVDHLIADNDDAVTRYWQRREHVKQLVADNAEDQEHQRCLTPEPVMMPDSKKRKTHFGTMKTYARVLDQEAIEEDLAAIRELGAKQNLKAKSTIEGLEVPKINRREETRWFSSGDCFEVMAKDWEQKRKVERKKMREEVEGVGAVWSGDDDSEVEKGKRKANKRKGRTGNGKGRKGKSAEVTPGGAGVAGGEAEG